MLAAANFFLSRVREEGFNSLLVEVQGDGKVLPCVLLNGRRPDLLVLAVQNLECVLWKAILAEDGTGLEVELVGGVVTSLVPDMLKEVD